MNSGSTASMQKVLVIGLDCAEPSLIFDRWRDELPNLKYLMDKGTYGELESCIPCITVPAWACMMSSKDPGQLGLYGFHNRKDYSYDRMTIANASAISEPLALDILSESGKSVISVGVPPSYPPRPVNGVMVGCFLTPSTDRMYTYPVGISQEIKELVGEYLVDVPHFRTEDKDYLLRQLYEMTSRRFEVIKHFLKTRSWDFFMFVEIGVDRIHHGFWQQHDPTHPRHQTGNPYAMSIRDYYRYIDSKIGELLQLLDDNTVVLVLSDHGAKTMAGGICLNEWLVKEGYLVLKTKPSGLVSLDQCEVDWTRTQAWGAGGYYGRVFLNVQGREPQGVIPPREYDNVRNELAGKLEGLTDPEGRALLTRAYKPEEIYTQCRGVPPDLIVYFGNLSWRAVGSLGLDDIYTVENDTGPDGANHAQSGIFIYYQPRTSGKGRVGAMPLFDVAPSVLHLLNVPVPSDMIGKVPEFLGPK